MPAMSDNNSGNSDNGTEGNNKPKDAAAEYAANLQAEIERHKADMAALQSEFNTADDATSPALVRKAFIAAAPAAIQELISLSTMAESESVRASTSKYIIDAVFGKATAESADAELTKLLQAITKPADKAADKKPTGK